MALFGRVVVFRRVGGGLEFGYLRVSIRAGAGGGLEEWRRGDGFVYREGNFCGVRFMWE